MLPCQVHKTLSDVLTETTHLNNWDSIQVISKVVEGLGRTIAQGQALKFEAIASFALGQKSKTTALDILNAPITELRDGKLKCAEKDIHPMLLAEAQKLLK